MNRLQYFVTVAKTGSLREAADVHRISPPAMSKAMRLLQEELGVTLLAQKGRGIRVTDDGSAFLQKLSPALDGLTRVLRRDDAAAEVAPPLRIGSFEVFTTHFLERAAKQYFADRRLLIHELTPGPLEEAVARGAVDVGLTYIPIPHPELELIRVGAIEMGIFAARGKFPKIEPGKTPFAVPITPIGSSPNRVRGLDGWPDDEFPRNTRYQVTLLETALGLCRRGLAALYAPRFIAAIHNELVRPEFRLEERTAPKISKRSSRTDVYLIRRKGNPETRDVKKLAAAVRTLAKN